LWLALVEFQSQHNPEKGDDLLVEVAQFRRNLRHGPDRLGRYQVLPVLEYLCGECPSAEAVLDMTVPTGGGVRHAPLLWEIAKDSADESLTALEQQKATWGALFWIPLMAGADSETIVQRWQTLVAGLSSEQQANVTGIALVFAELAKRGQVWKPILERWKMTESRWLMAGCRRPPMSESWSPGENLSWTS
jgi:hypothetical protein